VLVLLFCAVLLAIPTAAQQENHQATTSSLVRLLQSKGILTAQEVAMMNQASSPSEADHRLAQLLLSKGLITQTDYQETFEASVVPAATGGDSRAQLVPAVLSASTAASPVYVEQSTAGYPAPQ